MHQLDIQSQRHGRLTGRQRIKKFWEQRLYYNHWKLLAWLSNDTFLLHQHQLEMPTHTQRALKVLEFGDWNKHCTLNSKKARCTPAFRIQSSGPGPVAEVPFHLYVRWDAARGWRRMSCSSEIFRHISPVTLLKETEIAWKFFQRPECELQDCDVWGLWFSSTGVQKRQFYN